MSGTKKVAICGFYGNYNLGDEAMLTGMLNLLKKQSDELSFVVFSSDPKDTQNRYKVQTVHRLAGNLRCKFQRFLQILESQYFILGGGDLLRDSLQSSVASSWLQTLQQALNFNCKTIVLGVSVGDIWREETKALITKTLNRVDFLAVRDAQSKCKLEELGVKKTIHIISDLALEALPQFSQSESIPNKPLQIGVSVRHLSNRGSSVDIDTYPTLQKEIASTIDFLIEHYGVVAHFLPLRTFKDQYHHTDDDYVSSLGVLRHSRFSSNCVVHRYFESVEALSTRIGSLDMMIGMRLHSLILAAGAGIPVIGLEYDPKVGGFMAEINQSELAIPIREFESEKSLPKITKVLDDLPKARLSVQDGIEVYKQKRSKARESLLELFS